MSLTQSRNSVIDIAKGIGIMLVVLGHNPAVVLERGELFLIIYSFHLPLFFFISGIFLSRKGDIWSVVKTKADALLKPYFVILFLYGIFRYVTSDDGIERPLAAALYATGDTIGAPWTALWFLPHLFLIMVYSWIIVTTVKISRESRQWLATFGLLLIAAGVLAMHWLWENFPHYNEIFNLEPVAKLSWLPWSIDLVGVSMGYLLIGFLMREPIKAFKINYGYLVIAIMTFVVLHAVADESMDLNKRIYGKFFIVTIEALAGIYLTFSLAAFIDKQKLIGKLFSYIGSASLFILIFHSIQSKFYYFLEKHTNSGFLSALVGFVAGILFPILLYEITKRAAYLRMLLLPSIKKS